MIKRLRNSSGLSFIELIITLAILGITMISFSSLLANTNKINKKSELQYMATLLAQSYMERIKASDTINVGQTVDSLEDTKVFVDIVKIDKYKCNIYRIIIEISICDETYEKLEGYKIIYK